jgi:hypothetical protein
MLLTHLPIPGRRKQTEIRGLPTLPVTASLGVSAKMWGAMCGWVDFKIADLQIGVK